MKVRNFRDLMAGNKTAEIYCVQSKKLVRKLTLDGGSVRVDAMDGRGAVVSVPLDVPITVEPWVMDHGSLLFPAGPCDGLPQEAINGGSTAFLKICGQFDTIVYPDGSTSQVEADHA